MPMSSLFRGVSRHLPALLLFGVVSVFLFRLPLFDSYRFIGNPDRWNHYLSFAAFHSYNLAHGTFFAWCEYLFTGFDTLSLPFSFVSPLFALPALLGTADVVKVLGYVSPMILAGTLAVTYAVLQSICRDRLAATAGALIFGLSIWSILKLTQNDNSYLSVFISPPLFHLVRTTDRANLGRRIAVLTAVLWICIYWAFLNYFSYVVIFLVAYSCYRWVGGERSPLAAFLTSLALGAFLAAPRLVALFGGLAGSSRTHGKQVIEYVSPTLLLRYLDGDIFGRSWREGWEAHSMNLSEGNLLFASVFASLLLISIIGRGQYSAGVGLETARREVRYGFFIAFILSVLLIIHFKPAYWVFGLLFAKVSFLHTRFALAALFPIALVSSLVLVREPRWRLTSGRALSVAVLTVAILLLGMLDFDRVAAPLLAWLGQPGKSFVRVPGSRGAWVRVPEVLRLLVLAATFAGLLTARRLRLIDSGTLRTTIAVVIIGQTVLHADVMLNGPDTRTYKMPFEKYDAVMATSEEFLPPSGSQIRELHAALENDRYRTVLICPRELIPVDCSTAVGLVWRIRLVDGYLSDVPYRYASLPWPEGTVDFRSIRFSTLSGTERSLPGAWKLLSLLNVRNAVLVTRSLYTNDGFRVGDDLRLIRNPSPYVYPRAYFATHTLAADTPQAIQALDDQVGPCATPRARSCDPFLRRKLQFDFVEGPLLGDFDATGDITWHFAGGNVTLEFPPSPRKRFLVVNEAYHPGWTAHALGRELDVYATNVVMRGIVVPEGATRVTLRFHSVVEATGKYLAVMLPLGGVLALLTRERLRKLINRSLGATAPSG
jgi:hypothetical protein